jgi:hypothetical protein
MSASEITAGLVGFVLGCISTAVAKMVADWFREWRNRLIPHIEISEPTVSQAPDKMQRMLAFGISIEQGDTLNNAYIKLNGQRYKWFEEKTYKEYMKLLVGEDSKWFYPYSIILDYIADLSNQQNVSRTRKKKQSNHGILVTLKEVNTNAILFSNCYEMPIDLSSYHLHLHPKRKLSNLSLVLISDDIKHKTKFRADLYLQGLKVGKLEKGMPNLETVNVEYLIETYPSRSWVFG